MPYHRRHTGTHWGQRETSMKKTASVIIAAMAVLSFGGCKKKSDADKMLDQMESFKKDMCGCKEKDKACGEGVEKKMGEWMKSMEGKEKGKEKEKGTPEQEKRAE